MVDYSKKTVAELKEILESRSLPATGKKADLVARLADADKAAESNGMLTPQHHFSYADLRAAETKVPPAQPTPSGALPTKAPPVPAPPSKPAETSAAAATITEPVEAAGGAAEAAASPSANTDTQLANSTNYALGLQTSTVDDEMAKRKARADRFGTAATPVTEGANGETGAEGAENKEDEAQRALERAKRFGTGQTAMGKLDEALPSERERGPKKRGRMEENDAVMDDPGLIRKGGFSGKGGFRGRGRGRDARPGSRPRGERPGGVQKQAAYSNDQDRSAAEARKKRFAVPS